MRKQPIYKAWMFSNFWLNWLWKKRKRREGKIEEEKSMEETEPEKIEENNNRKKKKAEEDLPFCTTAPDAEHARAHNEDEPCDDGRSGSTDES
jgi:hypothetical protein